MFYPFLAGYYQICPTLVSNHQIYPDYTKCSLILRRTLSLLNLKHRKLKRFILLKKQFYTNLLFKKELTNINFHYLY